MQSWAVQHNNNKIYGKILNSPLWDTLGQNTSIQYAGPQLHSWHSYYWDHKGEMADLEREEVGHFMTGIIDYRKMASHS